MENLQLIKATSTELIIIIISWPLLTTFIASGGQVPKTTLQLASNPTPSEGTTPVASSIHNRATNPHPSEGMNK